MKYKLTKNKKNIGTVTVYQIKAVRDIPGIGVIKGDVGGWIENENNLSHDEDAWVSGDSMVYGNARVSGNARVYHNAIVYDDAVVSGDAIVYDDAMVTGHAKVYDDAMVYGNARVSGNARVYDDAMVSGHAKVYGNARVCGDAVVISGDARVYSNAVVYGDARLKYGRMTADIFEHRKQYIACSLNVYPVNGIYRLYKRVMKEKKGVYHSCYDKTVKYYDGKTTTAKNVNEDKLISCGGGLHVSTPFFWNEGDTLIAIDVKEKDIITCMAGKLRVRKLKTICEIKED